ncbi:MAG: hypothetical protein ACREM9_07770 [Gemmatimonadales bacterium]
MSRFYKCSDRVARAAVGVLILCAACSDDTTAPSTPTETPAETPIAPVEPSELAALTLDNRSSRPGIVFGTFNMRNNYLNKVHTGWMNGGPLEPSSILSWLSGARAKGGRVVVKLCKGNDKYVKNSNGTFSLTKWKALVSRYRNVKLGPYISDGTIVGHYLIDEPHRAGRWGGKAISQGTLEEMARFSKQIWPAMTTMVRVAPSWLASSSVNYRHLDAGWTQYTTDKGDAARWVASEAAAAKRKDLGLVVGLNVINGGNGSSRIRGSRSGKWSMSGSEIRNYGTAMLGQSLACAFFSWQHDTDYYGRSEIRSAMADVSAKARSHSKTSCRQ